MRSREGVPSFDPVALRRLRRAAGLSLDQVAASAGVTRQQLIAYEKPRGDKAARTPGMDTFTALAAALGLDDPLGLTTADTATATLADLRARRGVSKAAVAAHLDMTPGAWDAIERGRQPLRAGTARRVAELLEVDPEVVEPAWRRGLDTTIQDEGPESEPRRRHPASVTAHRLAEHLEQWPSLFSDREREAATTTIEVLNQVADGRRT